MVNQEECYFNTWYWKSRQEMMKAWTKVAAVKEIGGLKNQEVQK